MIDNPGSNEFMTPPDVIADARKVMDGIDLDPASHWIAQQHIKAKRFYGTRKVLDIEHLEDGLIQDWSNTNYSIWCNPPYSKGLIDKFVSKALYEYNKDVPFGIEHMMFLVNSQTDTRWYHTLLNSCNAALLFKGRLKFWKMFDGKAHEKWEGEKSKQEGKGKIGNQPRYLNTLFYFTRGNINTFVDVFGKRGTIIQVAGKQTKENEHTPFLRTNKVLYLDEYRTV